MLSGRLHVRRAGRPAATDRGVRRRAGSPRASTSSSGATSSGSRCSSAASPSACSCSGSAVTPRVEQRLYWVVGIGVVASIELGILGFLPAREDAFQLPLGRLVYGDLSPLAQGHALRHGVHRDDARLRAPRGDPVHGVARRAAGPALAGRSWSALVLCSGLSLSGHSSVEPGSSWRTELADWVPPVGRFASGSEGSCSSPSSSGRRRPSSGARRSSASRSLRPRSSA